jgi:hypothetical protein
MKIEMKTIQCIIFKFSPAVLVMLVNFLNGCGEGTVDVNEAKYEPKIVIEGYIYPEHNVDNIRITRNIPLDKTINFESVILYRAKVKLTDLSSGKEYDLIYNNKNYSFYYDKQDLKIDYGKRYRLEVWASVEGKNLYANSETIVPLKGLKIIDNANDTIKYRVKDVLGNLIKYNISFTPSPEAEIHAVSIVAENPGLSNFIYNNPYHNPDTSDIVKNISWYSNSSLWLQNFRPGSDEINFDIEWTSIWFYDRYRVILYAGDKNFKDFFLTQKDVQEMDGNFHEPKLHIEGEGIGVFASAVTDTAYFYVIH